MEDVDGKPIPTFRVTCEKCGGDDIFIKNNIRHGSPETGAWGEMEMYCRDCGNHQSIYEA